MWRKWSDILFWLGASLYFGGLLTLGTIVAPALFQKSLSAQLSMPGVAVPPLAMDKQVGGELFGEILNRFSVIEVIALGLMLSGLAGWILGHRHVRRSTFVVLLLWTLVAGLAAVDAAWMRPKVWNLREVVRQQAASHAADVTNTPWPDRAEFDRLHLWDETLGRSKAYALLAMIFVTAWRGLAERRSRPEDRSDFMRRTISNDH